MFKVYWVKVYWVFDIRIYFCKTVGILGIYIKFIFIAVISRFNWFYVIRSSCEDGYGFLYMDVGFKWIS